MNTRPNRSLVTLFSNPLNDQFKIKKTLFFNHRIERDLKGFGNKYLGLWCPENVSYLCGLSKRGSVYLIFDILRGFCNLQDVNNSVIGCSRGGMAFARSEL